MWEAAPHKATGFYKQKLVIISTPNLELCHPPGLLWFMEGQPLCHRVPGKPSPTFSGQMGTVMRERKPLWCLLHHKRAGDLSLGGTVAETGVSACFTIYQS